MIIVTASQSLPSISEIPNMLIEETKFDTVMDYGFLKGAASASVWRFVLLLAVCLPVLNCALAANAQTPAYASATFVEEPSQSVSAGISSVLGYSSPAVSSSYEDEVLRFADAMDGDPYRIEAFIKSNIETTFQFGLAKGGAGAYVDRSGNPFDQAELMVDALRAKSVPARYLIAPMTIDETVWKHWIRIDDQANAIRLLQSGGIPAESSGNSITLLHVFVEAQVEGSWVRFNPSLKLSAEIDTVTDPVSQLGLSVLDLRNAFAQGATITSANGITTAANLSNPISTTGQAVRNEITAAGLSWLQAIRSRPDPADRLLTRTVGGWELEFSSPFDPELWPQYTIGGSEKRFAGELPDELRTEITLLVPNPDGATPLFEYSFFSDQYYTKRITIRYEGLMSGADIINGVSFPENDYSLQLFAGHTSHRSIDPSLNTDANPSAYFLHKSDLISTWPALGGRLSGVGGLRLQMDVDHPYSAQSGSFADAQYEFVVDEDAQWDLVLSFGNMGESGAKYYQFYALQSYFRYQRDPGQECITYYEPAGPTGVCFRNDEAQYRFETFKGYRPAIVQDVDIRWREWAASQQASERLVEDISDNRVETNHRIGLVGAAGRGGGEKLSGEAVLQQASSQAVVARTAGVPVAKTNSARMLIASFPHEVFEVTIKASKYGLTTPIWTNGDSTIDAVWASPLASEISTADQFYLTDQYGTDAYHIPSATTRAVLDALFSGAGSTNRDRAWAYLSDGYDLLIARGGFSDFVVKVSPSTGEVLSAGRPILDPIVETQQQSSQQQSAAVQSEALETGGVVAQSSGEASFDDLRESILPNFDPFDPGDPGLRAALSRPLVRYDVNPQTGAFRYTPDPDIVLGSGRGQISFQRTYSSDKMSSGSLASGWDHNWDWSLQLGTNLSSALSPESAEGAVDTLSRLIARMILFEDGGNEEFIAALHFGSPFSVLENSALIDLGGSQIQFNAAIDGNFYPDDPASLASLSFSSDTFTYQSQGGVPGANPGTEIVFVRQFPEAFADVDGELRRLPTHYWTRFSAVSSTEPDGTRLSFDYDDQLARLKSVENQSGWGIYLHWANENTNHCPNLFGVTPSSTTGVAMCPITWFEPNGVDPCVGYTIGFNNPDAYKDCREDLSRCCEEIYNASNRLQSVAPIGATGNVASAAFEIEESGDDELGEYNVLQSVERVNAQSQTETESYDYKYDGTSNPFRGVLLDTIWRRNDATTPALLVNYSEVGSIDNPIVASIEDKLGAIWAYNSGYGYASVITPSVDNPTSGLIEPLVSQSYFDFAGRSAMSVDAAGDRALAAFDLLGRQVEGLSVPFGHPADEWASRVVNSYDEFSNLIQASTYSHTLPEYGSVPTSSLIAYRFYDDPIWPTAVTKSVDAEGIAISWDYDPLTGGLARELGPFDDLTPSNTLDDPDCSDVGIACSWAEYTTLGPALDRPLRVLERIYVKRDETSPCLLSVFAYGGSGDHYLLESVTDSTQTCPTQ